VGTVAATGNVVSRVKVGDRVAAIFYPKWLDGRVAAGKMGQACETYLILSENEFIERFELAEPGKDFALIRKAI